MANYFNNKDVTKVIIEYLSYPLEERSVNSVPLELRSQILKEVAKIINGIIFTHKFTVWEHYDDLFQEAAMACVKALDKFNPEYRTPEGKSTTAFNYFSLTAKRCLKFYTIRNKKNRDNYALDDYGSVLKADNYSESTSRIVRENLVSGLRVIFNSKKYKKFQKLIDIFEEYLKKMGFFNKRDFFRFSKSYGWSPNLIRKFLKIIKDNKEFLNDNVNSVSVPGGKDEHN